MHWVVSRSYKERFKLLCNTWCYGCLGYVPLRARRDHQPTAQAKFWKIFKGLRKFWKSVEWLNRGRRSRILTYFLHFGMWLWCGYSKTIFLGGWVIWAVGWWTLLLTGWFSDDAATIFFFAKSKLWIAIFLIATFYMENTPNYGQIRNSHIL
jgi:hypothetical protein